MKFLQNEKICDEQSTPGRRRKIYFIELLLGCLFRNLPLNQTIRFSLRLTSIGLRLNLDVQTPIGLEPATHCSDPIRDSQDRPVQEPGSDRPCKTTINTVRIISCIVALRMKTSTMLVKRMMRSTPCIVRLFSKGAIHIATRLQKQFPTLTPYWRLPIIVAAPIKPHMSKGPSMRYLCLGLGKATVARANASSFLQHDRPTEPLLKSDCHTATLAAIHNVRLLKRLTRNWHFAPVV